MTSIKRSIFDGKRFPHISSRSPELLDQVRGALTRNQTLSALLFLYREVLQIERDADLSLTPAKRPMTRLQRSVALRCAPIR